ncbi:hypothetical protein E6C27_scaffold1204G00060 [Cucumis melo var. makuwa]|uniref:Uncharacterized protein n=1 Tax=Cucumis melo var. makuwa TaxID=1194695 RepID=A0A5A7SKT2_CUCMM|nr:hypothetical protein E6C27_scaffold1204G00060 [Cucumis melo var. makuwa]
MPACLHEADAATSQFISRHHAYSPPSPSSSSPPSPSSSSLPSLHRIAVAATSISDPLSVSSNHGSVGHLCIYYKRHLLLRVPFGATQKVQTKPQTVAAVAVLIFVRRRVQPSSWVPRQVHLGIAPFTRVDSLSVDSIKRHNQVSGKGFLTTGPQIEAGNVTPMPGCSVHSSYVNGLCCELELIVDGLKSLKVRLIRAFFGITRLICASFGITRPIRASFGITRPIRASFGITRLIDVSFGITRLMCAFYGTTRLFS